MNEIAIRHSEQEDYLQRIEPNRRWSLILQVETIRLRYALKQEDTRVSYEAEQSQSAIEDHRYDSIVEAIIERNEARRVQDYQRADAIRSGLAAKGIVLEDGTGVTTWRRI